MRAIRITEFGGPEVLTLADVPVPEPGPGQFLVDVSRAGVNYADTHQAENSYLSRTTLPHIPVAEIVGRAGAGRRAVAMVRGGRPVDVVLDMTGGRITDESVAALAPFGRLAFYGMANRQPPTPIAPGALLARSTTVAGMWLPHAFRIPGLVSRAMTELFELVAA